MSELKECEECKSDNVELLIPDGHIEYFSVACLACDNEGDYQMTADEAKFSWNRRTP